MSDNFCDKLGIMIKFVTKNPKYRSFSMLCTFWVMQKDSAKCKLFLFLFLF